MDHHTWKGIVLEKQGLLTPKPIQYICQNLNGLQAQFQSYVDEGFRQRLGVEVYQKNMWQHQLTRQWSIRRTVHAYLKSEIPLYIHEGRMASTAYLNETSNTNLSPQVKQKFHAIILEALEEVSLTRQQLKEICRMNSMTIEEEKHLFNAWGGMIRYMVERGEIYQEYGERRFHRLTDFQPLPKEIAELEIARRYFSGFGPVSLTDARYYFKESKTTILSWMKQLDLKVIQVEGRERFYLGELVEAELPECRFIAGFDQLLLGYEKKENPFFDPNVIRSIYTLTGIVKPVVYFKGRFVATWRYEKNKVQLDYFLPLSEQEMKVIEEYKRLYEAGQEW